MLAMLTLVASLSLNPAPPPDPDSFFELQIRPVLAGTCFKCHGGQKVSGGLRVDSRAALLKGGDSGPAIVPGEPDRSLLIQAIRRTRDDLQMPPGKPLAAGVVADFTAWVQRGAPWPRKAAAAFRDRRLWAFEPVRKVRPPADPTAWAANPVDCFIRATLRDHGLRPAAQADRRTLIRRVTFDLIGLPPTPEEVAAFVNDRSPDAWEKVIDRLLASPHYGERWGRHWLDVARYADTAGDNADYPIPEARLYRDYVIASLNADKPYDRFVREQLAGDILAAQGPPEKYTEQVVATGFLALSRRYATGPYELWHLTLEDAIDTTGQAFLGLTLRCARCHDHKFDPVTKEDYYALYGIFASTQFPWAGAEEFASKKFPRQHFVPLLPPAEAARRRRAYREKTRQLRDEIRRIQTGSLAKRVAELSRRIQEKSAQVHTRAASNEDVRPLQAEHEALQKEHDQANHQLQLDLNHYRVLLFNLVKAGLPPDLPGAYAVQEGKPQDVCVQIRGEPDQQGPVVRRGAPRFLSGGRSLAIPAGSSGRLELARWLTRPDNPLTARVLVNRVWQHHFGKGLVGTPSNFGLRGEPPTHPELLDWLTARFIESGWSIKALHREILLSRTYRQAGTEDEAAAKDPANRWYGHFDRRRLDAEALRDSLLTVGGNLDRTLPGPHPFPPIDQWTWTQHNPFKAAYPSCHRSVYLMTQRIQRHPYLGLFDGPDANTTTAVRGSATVPQQALFLMNSLFVREQAEAFARRLIAASADPRMRVELAHQLAWGRPASEAEVGRAVRYLEEYGGELVKAGVTADRQELEAWTSYARVLLSANEFLYVD